MLFIQTIATQTSSLATLLARADLSPWLWLGLGVIVLGALLYLGSGYYLFRRTFHNPRLDPLRLSKECPEASQRAYEAIRQAVAQFDALPAEQWELEREGLKLKAYFLPRQQASASQSEGSAGLVVLVHGWRDNAQTRMKRALAYHAANYDVLVPDLRAHGASAGKYIDMACLKYQDLFAWVDLARTRLQPFPQHIIWEGLSMGAATVLSLSSRADLPPETTAIIADCGYSSLWEQGKWNLRHLPSFLAKLLLQSCWLWGELILGVRSSSPTPLTQVQSSHSPTFIIHGAADDYVPFFMGKELYLACSAELKEYWAVEGAGHGLAEFCAGPAYQERILEFIAKAKTARKGEKYDCMP